MKRYGLAFLMLFWLQPASATYTVVDEELPTYTTVDAQPYTFTIPFLKHRSLLTKDARNALQAALPYLRNQNIKITAKTDATLYTGGKLAFLVENRANRLRDYLLAQGIPASRMTIETDHTPNPQADGVYYPSYITVLNRRSPSSATSGQGYFQSQGGYTLGRDTDDVTKAALLPEDLSAKDMVSRFIVSSARNNLMSGASALRLLSLLDVGSPAPSHVSSALPIQRESISPVAVRASLQDQSARWLLSPEKSLEENLRAWASINNFTLRWSATDAYRVKKASVVTGSFLEAVDRVVAAAGLSMSVSPKAATIFINDKSE